jgi:carbamoyltransferase
MNLGIYGSHNASVCYGDGFDFNIIELERVFGLKNCSMMTYNQIPHPSDEELINFFYKLKTEVNEPVDNVYFNQLSTREIDIINKTLNPTEFIKKSHHFGHAASAFYQSPYDKAIIFSYDGGGEDETGTYSSFNIYIGDKSNKNISLYKTVPLNLGSAHCYLGIPISEIKKDINTLQYSGKLMGLAPFGNVRKDWESTLVNYYRSKHDLSLLNEIGLDCRENQLNGQVSYDLSATSEYVFSVLFQKEYFEVMNVFKGWNVVLTGGCALNVKTNQLIYNHNKNVFIPPNPNDAGLSFGFLFDDFIKDYYDMTYKGVDILDKKDFWLHKCLCQTEHINLLKLVNELKNGLIFGIIIGKSEVGPRALGNRSIICYPAISNMKDIINSKIKFREWFRPFAPVVRLEDVNKYFEFNSESRFMSFCPKIRDKYKTILKEIVHIDGTCRVQTITNEQHPFLYSLLTEMESSGLIPVLLNTSFNIKGRPILSKYEDAIDVLLNTPLDGVITNEVILKKPAGLFYKFFDIY